MDRPLGEVMTTTTTSDGRRTARSKKGTGRDPERTRNEILEVATKEFVRAGLSGARVDEIAAKTSSTKRMIYYYFGDKDGLYTAVLERVYEEIRDAEQQLDLSGMDARQALRRMVEFAFDYHTEHPELGRLVSIENIHHAAHLELSSRQQTLNLPILKTMDDLLTRGRAEGVVNRPVRAIEVHLVIMSWAMFQVTSRNSIRASFAYDMQDAAHHARHREIAVEVILGWLGTSE